MPGSLGTSSHNNHIQEIEKLQQEVTKEIRDVTLLPLWERDKTWRTGQLMCIKEIKIHLDKWRGIQGWVAQRSYLSVLKAAEERVFSGKTQLSCAAHTTQQFGSQKYEQLQNRSQRKDPVITVKVNSLDATLISEPLSHLLPGTGQISSPAGLL